MTIETYKGTQPLHGLSTFARRSRIKMSVISNLDELLALSDFWAKVPYSNHVAVGYPFIFLSHKEPKRS